MRRRHHLPRIWLMTDERIDDLSRTVAQLPRGAGIVFRHHATPPRERRALFDDVRRLARRRRLLLLFAGPPDRARAWGADGAHHRSALRSRGLRSVAVHDARELTMARRVGADLIFVSPIFPTASHPGARPMGPVRLGLLVSHSRERVIALGGLGPRRARHLSALGIHGWAAIDALS